jgi:HSP20 family protein
MSTIVATRRPSRLPSLLRDPFTALREEMNDLSTRFLGDEGEGWFAGTVAPSLDLSETENTVEVRMDLPGVTAQEIDIQISGNVLTVSGQRKEEKEEKGRMYHRVERRYGGFSRSVTLPCIVAENEVAAEYRDGVLAITMPKTDESKAHKIKVKG